MLVSSIARFNAVNNMNNAAMNMMNAANSFTNLSAFGGEHDLTMLHEKDKKLSLDLASNSLLYKISYLQEKAAQKRQQQEMKRNLDLMV
ncbi:TPA: hypothetical protein IAC10_06010 [Candidatus Scatousia excrementigallinarum]|uniref:Uncharacterized protein n=1 Tax=Candidatus Scatousia excrementigallinarum TaxID=2840935 RepID=A0A9D1JMQ6_9BACT|nr:hypothetical protein [Candidatus Scatousia excrementigallinarum]